MDELWEATRDIVLVSNLTMQLKTALTKVIIHWNKKTHNAFQFGRMRKIIQRTERSFRIFKALSKTLSG